MNIQPSTSTERPPIRVTNVSWFLLFMEIIAIYSESPMKKTNALCGKNVDLLLAKGDGTSSYHSALRA
jgi:hypothetical protein